MVGADLRMAATALMRPTMASPELPKPWTPSTRRVPFSTTISRVMRSLVG